MEISKLWVLCQRYATSFSNEQIRQTFSWMRTVYQCSLTSDSLNRTVQLHRRFLLVQARFVGPLQSCYMRSQREKQVMFTRSQSPYMRYVGVKSKLVDTQHGPAVDSLWETALRWWRIGYGDHACYIGWRPPPNWAYKFHRWIFLWKIMEGRDCRMGYGF